jgi:hypothetical protein
MKMKTEHEELREHLLSLCDGHNNDAVVRAETADQAERAADAVVNSTSCLSKSSMKPMDSQTKPRRILLISSRARWPLVTRTYGKSYQTRWMWRLGIMLLFWPPNWLHLIMAFPDRFIRFPPARVENLQRDDEHHDQH